MPADKCDCETCNPEKTIAALRAKLAAWEACAEPFEITDPAEFQKEIKRLMDDPQAWMISLDKAMKEREALHARLAAAEKEKPCPFPESENKHISVALCGWRGSQLGLLSSRRNDGDLVGVGKWFDACPDEWRSFASWLLRVAGVERLEKFDILRAQVSAVEKENAELHREIATVVETYRGANEQLHRELKAAKAALKAVLDDPAKCYGPCNETRAKVSAALWALEA